MAIEILNDRSRLLDSLARVARDAGAVIMDVYATDFIVRGKDDASPVTKADELAEQVIVSALKLLTPGVVIVAEEAVASGQIVELADRFWLVDPLDGTKEFVGRNGEFTVNIALIEKGVPTLGVVYAPALNRLFAGGTGLGAYVEENGVRRTIKVREVPVVGLTVVASRSHADTHSISLFLSDKKVAELRNAGSSIKICLVAAGEADIYPRLGRTMEWDIAAGHAIVSAAGGSLKTLDGELMCYGKPGFENSSFVVVGRE